MRNNDCKSGRVFAGAGDTPVVAVRLTSHGQHGLLGGGGPAVAAVGSTSVRGLPGRRWSLNRRADEVRVSVQRLCAIVGGRVSGLLGLPSVLTSWQALVSPVIGTLFLDLSSSFSPVPWGPCWVSKVTGSWRQLWCTAALGTRGWGVGGVPPGREEAGLSQASPPLRPRLVPPA